MPDMPAKPEMFLFRNQPILSKLRPMKLLGVIAWLLAAALPVLARDEPVDLEDIANSAEQWAKENLDETALQALNSLDQDQVKSFFRDLENQFHSAYVLDLPRLRATAKAMVPLLESTEETRPYAAWLKPRLDYLEVAEEFRHALPPVATNHPPAKLERQFWAKRVEDRPPPKNAATYVPLLKPIFAGQKVPPQLVWIAEVESSFDRTARSPAGAAGLFQLMPATARRFGLRTWPFDQRYRPEESARAAAQYLAFLHRRFQDWPLALAAYNAGEGTVQKALDRQQARSFDAIAPHLPAETQMYVPRIEATLARREGIQLSQLRLPKS